MDEYLLDEHSATTALSLQCKQCRTPFVMVVPTAGFYLWQSGDYIQDALRSLNADEREMLLMTWCQPCVTTVYSLFGDDED